MNNLTDRTFDLLDSLCNVLVVLKFSQRDGEQFSIVHGFGYDSEAAALCIISDCVCMNLVTMIYAAALPIV